MKVFLDTNILIYAYDNSDQVKHQKAYELISQLVSKSEIVISIQVVNEFIVILNKKVKNPFTIDEIIPIILSTSFLKILLKKCPISK